METETPVAAKPAPPNPLPHPAIERVRSQIAKALAEATIASFAELVYAHQFIEDDEFGIGLVEFCNETPARATSDRTFAEEIILNFEEVALTLAQGLCGVFGLPPAEDVAEGAWLPEGSCLLRRVKPGNYPTMIIPAEHEAGDTTAHVSPDGRNECQPFGQGIYVPKEALLPYPDPRDLRGSCPQCGLDLVSNLYYVPRRGYLMAWECLGSLPPLLRGDCALTQTCAYRRIL